MNIRSKVRFTATNPRTAKAGRAAGVIAAGAFFGAAIAALPVSLDGASFDVNAAWAVGNGKGNGGVGQGKGKGAAHGSFGGELSSKMGSLNSAKANRNAFLHASADSTIGKIAAAYGALSTYTDAKEALQALWDDYNALTPEEQADPLVGGVILTDIATAEGTLATATTAAATALEPAANKDGLIDGDVVDAVAGLMDGKLD